MINEIVCVFERENKLYIHFTAKKSIDNFLYVVNKSDFDRSLLFGINFKNALTKLLNLPNIRCVECQLQSEISGAITLDTGNLSYNNITPEEANRILQSLKQKVSDKKDLIKLF